MANARPRVCHVCLATFPTAADRAAHMSSDHPGFRIEWSGRDPIVVDPDGNRREVSKAATARAIRAAGRPPRPASAKPARGRRTIEAIAAAADDAGAARTEDVPADDEPAPRGRRPYVDQGPIRITPEYVRGSMRETVQTALTLDMLATILRDLSIAISAADGAGEDGWLSRIEAVQLANLLYDVTIDTIVSRFGGNVGRFKLALAAILILIGKGRVHARAIARNVANRRATTDADRAIRAAAERQAEAVDDGEALAVDPYDPMAVLARQQAEARKMTRGDA